MFEKFKRTFGYINQHALARKKLLLAYTRFFLWQIQSHLNKNFIIKPFIGKVRFYAKKGLTGVTGNIYTGLHEFEDMSFLLHFLRKDDIFFDIGANVGSYSLLASGYIGAKTLAFEPVPSTFYILKRNITLNSLEDKIQANNCAIGNADGHIKFSANLDTVNHVIANNETDVETIEVPIKKLNNYKNTYPNLIKIDVEGFEQEVFNGGKEIFVQDNLKAIIIELNGSGGRYGYDEKNIHNYLIEIGYFPYSYAPLIRTFSKLNSFGNHNTIYIKDIDFVANRCNSAQKVKILGASF